MKKAAAREAVSYTHLDVYKRQVNALPIAFAPKVLDAAIAVKANYQDFAATDVLDEWWPTCCLLYTSIYGDTYLHIGCR